MSNQQSNKTKFIIGILAMTSLAALAPSANAQTVKPSAATENILNRANLNTDSVKKQQPGGGLSPSIERLDRTKLGDPLRACDGGGSTNNICSKKPGLGRDSIKNPAPIKLDQPLPQIRK